MQEAPEGFKQIGHFVSCAVFLQCWEYPWISLNIPCLSIIRIPAATLIWSYELTDSTYVWKRRRATTGDTLAITALQTTGARGRLSAVQIWLQKNLLSAQIKCLAVRSSGPHESEEWHRTQTLRVKVAMAVHTQKKVWAGEPCDLSSGALQNKASLIPWPPFTLVSATVFLPESLRSKLRHSESRESFVPLVPWLIPGSHGKSNPRTQRIQPSKWIQICPIWGRVFWVNDIWNMKRMSAEHRNFLEWFIRSSREDVVIFRHFLYFGISNPSLFLSSRLSSCRIPSCSMDGIHAISLSTKKKVVTGSLRRCNPRPYRSSSRFGLVVFWSSNLSDPDIMHPVACT